MYFRAGCSNDEDDVNVPGAVVVWPTVVLYLLLFFNFGVADRKTLESA